MRSVSLLAGLALAIPAAAFATGGHSQLHCDFLDSSVSLSVDSTGTEHLALAELRPGDNDNKLLDYLKIPAAGRPYVYHAELSFPENGLCAFPALAPSDHEFDCEGSGNFTLVLTADYTVGGLMNGKEFARISLQRFDAEMAREDVTVPRLVGGKITMVHWVKFPLTLLFTVNTSGFDGSWELGGDTAGASAWSADDAGHGACQSAG